MVGFVLGHATRDDTLVGLFPAPDIIDADLDRIGCLDWL
jgi:hypothetical protein